MLEAEKAGRRLATCSPDNLQQRDRGRNISFCNLQPMETLEPFTKDRSSRRAALKMKKAGRKLSGAASDPPFTAPSIRAF